MSCVCFPLWFSLLFRACRLSSHTHTPNISHNIPPEHNNNNNPSSNQHQPSMFISQASTRSLYTPYTHGLYFARRITTTFAECRHVVRSRIRCVCMALHPVFCVCRLHVHAPRQWYAVTRSYAKRLS